MKKITLILCAFLLIALPATASLESACVLRFPLPEDAELIESRAGFELYQFGKTVMNTTKHPRTDPGKTLEDYIAQTYSEYEEYEAFLTVDIDGDAAECGQFFYVFEGERYPQLSALLKTDEADYLLLIDCGADEPPMERIKSWMSELELCETTIQ